MIEFYYGLEHLLIRGSNICSGSNTLDTFDIQSTEFEKHIKNVSKIYHTELKSVLNTYDR